MSIRLVVATLALPAIACRPPSVPPRPETRPPDWALVSTYLDSVVSQGAAPGAVLGISQAGRHFVYGTGRLGQDDATRPDSNTVYDLASLAKVIGLTTAVMLGVSEGKLDLDAPVVRYLPAFGDDDRSVEPSNRRTVTLRHLLAHSSGLPAWRPIYQLTSTRTEALAMIDTVSLDTIPGVRALYSDLGAIILTQVVEAALHQRIDSLLARRVFGPLSMASARYLPSAHPPIFACRLHHPPRPPTRIVAGLGVGHAVAGQ